MRLSATNLAVSRTNARARAVDSKRRRSYRSARGKSARGRANDPRESSSLLHDAAIHARGRASFLQEGGKHAERGASFPCAEAKSRGRGACDAGGRALDTRGGANVPGERPSFARVGGVVARGGASFRDGRANCGLGDASCLDLRRTSLRAGPTSACGCSSSARARGSSLRKRTTPAREGASHAGAATIDSTSFGAHARGQPLLDS